MLLACRNGMAFIVHFFFFMMVHKKRASCNQVRSYPRKWKKLKKKGINILKHALESAGRPY